MQTPALERLMGAYFHQDFTETHGGPWQTISAFLSGEPGLAVSLSREIEMVLRALPTEDDVERYLDELGCEYWPGPAEGGYRGWLAAVAAYVSARTGSTS